MARDRIEKVIDLTVAGAREAVAQLERVNSAIEELNNASAKGDIKAAKAAETKMKSLKAAEEVTWSNYKRNKEIADNTARMQKRELKNLKQIQKYGAMSRKASREQALIEQQRIKFEKGKVATQAFKTADAKFMYKKHQNAEADRKADRAERQQRQAAKDAEQSRVKHVKAANKRAKQTLKLEKATAKEQAQQAKVQAAAEKQRVSQRKAGAASMRSNYADRTNRYKTAMKYNTAEGIAFRQRYMGKGGMLNFLADKQNGKLIGNARYKRIQSFRNMWSGFNEKAEAIGGYDLTAMFTNNIGGAVGSQIAKMSGGSAAAGALAGTGIAAAVAAVAMIAVAGTAAAVKIQSAFVSLGKNVYSYAAGNIDPMVNWQSKMEYYKSSGALDSSISQRWLSQRASALRMGWEDYSDLMTMGMARTGSTFKDSNGKFDTDRIANFVESLYAGGSFTNTSEEISQSTRQLFQSFGKGLINGDELRSIIENNAFLSDALAGFYGVESNQLVEMGANGEIKITSELIDHIIKEGQKYVSNLQKMSWTTEQATDVMKNSVDQGFEPLTQQLSGILNTAMGAKVQSAVTNGAGIVADMGSQFLTGLNPDEELMTHLIWTGSHALLGMSENANLEQQGANLREYLMSDEFSADLTALGENIGEIVSTGGHLMEQLPETFTNLSDIAQKFNEVAPALLSALDTIYDVVSFIDDLGSLTPGGTFKDLFWKGVDWLTSDEGGKQVSENYSSMVNYHVPQDISSITGNVETAKTNAVAAVEETNNAVTGVANEATGAMTSISEEASTWGLHLAENFAAGLTSGSDIVSAAAVDLAGKAAGPLHQSVADYGPLAHTDEWGGHLVENIATGITDNSYRLAQASNYLANRTEDSMKDAMVQNYRNSLMNNWYRNTNNSVNTVNSPINISMGSGFDPNKIGEVIADILDEAMASAVVS